MGYPLCYPWAIPWATPKATTMATPQANHRATPWASFQATPKLSPGLPHRQRPWATLQATPRLPPRLPPWATPRANPWATPRPSPGATPRQPKYFLNRENYRIFKQSKALWETGPWDMMLTGTRFKQKGKPIKVDKLRWTLKYTHGAHCPLICQKSTNKLDEIHATKWTKLIIASQNKATKQTKGK